MMLRYCWTLCWLWAKGFSSGQKTCPRLSPFYLFLIYVWRGFIHPDTIFLFFFYFYLQQRLGWRHWCTSYTRSRGAFKGKMQKTMDSWLDRRRAFWQGIGSLASCFWWIMVRASTALIWTFVLLESRDKRSLTDKRKRWEFFCFFLSSFERCAFFAIHVRVAQFR